MLAWLLRVWRVLPLPLRNVYLRVRYAHFAVGLTALIQDERGRLLIVRRTYSRDEPWALPGGWLESGDSGLERALERELREETGLRVRVGPVRGVEDTGFAIVLLLQAELLDPLTDFRPSAEVSEVAWVERSQLASLSKLNARLLDHLPDPGPSVRDE